MANRKDTSQRRRTTQLSQAERIRKFLYHIHGKEPSLLEDFQQADQSSWTDRWTENSVTKNGNPKPDDPLGDSDGRSFNNFSSSVYLDFGDKSNFDPSTSDFTVFTFSEFVQSDNNRVFEKIGAGNEGWALYYKYSSGEQIYYNEDSDGSGRATPKGKVNFSDGSLHSLCGIFDQDGDRNTISVDGVIRNEKSLSSNNVSDVKSNSSLKLGAGKNSYHEGRIGLSFILNGSWLSEPQLKYLDSVLRDRTIHPSALDQWVYGQPETGLSRRLPKYITDAFGQDGPDFWWSADRDIHHVDGEQVVQLCNFSNGNQSPKPQRDPNNNNIQYTARGSSTRGEPLDYLEGSSGDHFDAEGIPSSMDAFTFSCVIYENANTDRNAIQLWRASNGTRLDAYDLATDGDFIVRFTDENGNENQHNFSSLSTPDDYLICVGRCDTSTGESSVYVETTADGKVSNKISGSFTGSFKPETPDSEIFGYTGSNLYSIEGRIYDYLFSAEDIGDSAAQQLRNDLANRWL